MLICLFAFLSLELITSSRAIFESLWNTEIFSWWACFVVNRINTFFASYGIFATVTITFAVNLHIVNVNRNFAWISKWTTHFFIQYWKFQCYDCESTGILLQLRYTNNEAINVNGITNNWTAEERKGKLRHMCMVCGADAVCAVCVTQ